MTAIEEDVLPEQHDIAAEQAALGSAMLSPPALDEVLKATQSGDYYRPAHRIVYEAVDGLHDQGVPVDAITVAEELRRRGQLGRIDGAPYLHTLIAAVPSTASAGYYASIVRSCAVQRRRERAAWQLLELVQQPDADPARLAELATQAAESGAARPGSGGLAVVDLEPAAEAPSFPELICGDRLYRGAVHTISGPPDSGKTTLACWWMLQAVREAGGVLFLDEEGGREIVAEKFQALGARPGERIGYIQFPSRSWTPADIAALGAVLADRRPAMVAWDSSAAFLARAGLDENAAADVTRFYSQVLTVAARQYGAAVLVIDHDTKSSEPSRYARGSGAKLAAVDVAYKITPVRAFSKTESGSSKLFISKDRRGWLERSHEIAFIADSAADTALSVSISAADAGDMEEPDLPPAARKVAEALDSVPRTIRELTDRIADKHGHGLTRPTMQKSLTKLLDLGLARQAGTAPDSSQLWRTPDE